MRDPDPQEPDPIADRDEGEMLRAAAEEHAAARALVEEDGDECAPIIDLDPHVRGDDFDADLYWHVPTPEDP